MEPRATAAAYDQIAPHWVDRAFDLTNGIAAHERALALRRGRGGRALDVGCGANGRFISLLRQHGYEAEGLDLSAAMLALARRHLPEVVFHHADICTWEPAGRYDFITAWDSLWHVPLDRQPAVLAKLARALTPGGVLIFTSGGLEHADERTNPCHGVPLYHATPGVPALLRVLTEERLLVVHFKYDQLPESHVYFIAQRA